jgi:hypothetical protein
MSNITTYGQIPVNGKQGNITSYIEGAKGYDSITFNKDFEIEKSRDKLLQTLIDEEKLRLLNERANRKSVWQYSPYDICIGITDTWFNILDDMLHLKFNIEIFTKEKRLFFVGITILFFGIIMYIYNFIESSEIDTCNQQSKIIKHYYYKQNDELDELKNIFM